MMNDSFEWNPEKAEANLNKHGVSFEEAASVFYDTLSLTVSDAAHSNEENRFIITGFSDEGRHLVVVHIDRNDKIRIISARLATPSEKRKYEQETK